MGTRKRKAVNHRYSDISRDRHPDLQQAFNLKTPDSPDEAATFIIRIKMIGVLVLCWTLFLGGSQTFAAKKPHDEPSAYLLATGLQGALGSTIGPGGDLYVTEGAAGRITRVDPRSGELSTFASCLPPAIAVIGGGVDVAFNGSTAYALVTLVGPDLGGSDTVGIYRVDGPNTCTVLADIGEFSLDHPPDTDFFIPTGVQYAMEALRGGFLVTDGHHNRVLWISLDGEISELIAFDDVVPTGLALWGNTVYMSQAGPVPHLPEDGKIVAFGFKSPVATEVASGARLAVDVEFGLGRSLYALSQGFHAGGPDGSPAEPNTGSLMKVNGDGSLTTVIDGLDRPTSMEFIGNTAYVITLTGEIWKIDDVSAPPFGVWR